jgi:hypothetical protein
MQQSKTVCVLAASVFFALTACSGSTDKTGVTAGPYVGPQDGGDDNAGDDEGGEESTTGTSESTSTTGPMLTTSSGGSESSDTDATPPQGDLLWSSEAWSNGNPRELEPESEDPDDPLLFFSHAGEGGEASIDGEGTLTLNGMRSRFFIVVPNRDVMFEFEATVEDPVLTNISTALRTNHDEEGSFGKYGMHFDFGHDNEAGAKVEYYHNDHSSQQAATLDPSLELDKTYGFRHEIKNAEDGSRKVIQNGWIRYPGEDTWTHVLEAVWTEENWGEPEEDLGHSEYEDYKDGPWMLEGRRIWVRVNGDDVTSGTKFSNMSVRALPSNPE